MPDFEAVVGYTLPASLSWLGESMATTQRSLPDVAVPASQRAHSDVEERHTFDSMRLNGYTKPGSSLVIFLSPAWVFIAFPRCLLFYIYDSAYEKASSQSCSGLIDAHVELQRLDRSLCHSS